MLSHSRCGSQRMDSPHSLRNTRRHLEQRPNRAKPNNAVPGDLSDMSRRVKVSPMLAALSSVALLAASTSSATAHEIVMQVASTEGDVAHTAEVILRPLLTLYTFLYIIRIPMTWYPDIDGTKAPWSLVVTPTEVFLAPIRSTIGVGGVGGVDVSPIILVSLVSFLNEILLGQQGILMLIQIQAASGF